MHVSGETDQKDTERYPNVPQETKKPPPLGCAPPSPGGQHDAAALRLLRKASVVFCTSFSARTSGLGRQEGQAGGVLFVAAGGASPAEEVAWERGGAANCCVWGLRFEGMSTCITLHTLFLQPVVVTRFGEEYT